MAFTMIFSGCNFKKENASSTSSIKEPASSFVFSSEVSTALRASSTPSAVSSAFVDNSPIIENDSTGIPDKVFYKAILSALGKALNEKFTQNEALKLTFFAYGQEFYKEKITNIIGVGYLKNVSFLHLANNEITDLSPVLSLKNLKNLNLSHNSIEDISSLSKLTGVDVLNLAYNNILDVSPLSNIKNLKELDLWYNSITDISPLLNLTTLNILNLESNYLNMGDENTVKNISSLKNRIKYFSLGVQGAKKSEIRKTPYYLFIGKQQALDENRNVYYTKATLDGSEIELNKLYVLKEPKQYQIFLWDNKGTQYGIALTIQKTN
jgi:Leucine-rich repeat (LRR) protein